MINTGSRYHDCYKVSITETLYLLKRSKAMDTVWWFLTGRKLPC